MRSIGIVGSGAIVQSGHLPSYQAAGFQVAAIFDPHLDKARAVAETFGIPRVCLDLDELLSSDIEVVDIAVPASNQPRIVLESIRKGKHMLCQKPLAVTAREAEPLVEAAEAASLKLAVNVNMRWEPAMREASNLIRNGAIGNLQSAIFDVKYYENWASWPWMISGPRLLILYDTIHILDLIRSLMGEPLFIKARYGKSADDDVAAETWADIRFDYGNRSFARIDEDSRFNPEDTSVRYRFTGSTGSISGILGLYYDYPVGRPDTLKLVPAGTDENTVAQQNLPGKWIPDAFSETMRALLAAIENEAEPENSGKDHLRTLRLVDSIYAANSLELRPHRPD